MKQKNYEYCKNLMSELLLQGQKQYQNLKSEKNRSIQNENASFHQNGQSNNIFVELKNNKIDANNQTNNQFPLKSTLQKTNLTPKNTSPFEFVLKMIRQKDQILQKQTNDTEFQINKQLDQQLNQFIEAQINESNIEEEKEIPDLSRQNIAPTLFRKTQTLKTRILALNDSKCIKEGFPSHFQIKNCINWLKSQFPYLQIERYIINLHKNVHENCKLNRSQNDFKNTNEQSNHQRYSLNQNIRFAQPLNIPDNDEKFFQEKTIAMSFLKSGYGLRVLREQIKDSNITATKYNNMMTTVMKMAFRKVQQFMRNSGKSINPLNSQDEKILRSPLTNCDKWLPSDQYETFKNFIRLAYNLNQNVQIYPQIAFKLYNSVMKQLKIRSEVSDFEKPRKQKRNQQKDALLNNPRILNVMKSPFNQIDHLNSHLSIKPTNLSMTKTFGNFASSNNIYYPIGQTNISHASFNKSIYQQNQKMGIDARTFHRQSSLIDHEFNQKQGWTTNEFSLLKNNRLNGISNVYQNLHDSNSRIGADTNLSHEMVNGKV